MTLLYFVDIFQLDSDAKQKKIATFKMDESDGKVEIEPEDADCNSVVENVVNDGIFDYKYARPGKLFPSDGLSFLENLKYYFRSGYLLATDVYKKVVE